MKQPRLPSKLLDLTVRVYNALKRTGVSTVVMFWIFSTKAKTQCLLSEFGDKSLAELKAKLIEKGFLDEEEAE
jgi:DNA-directed RNA polymerase subunit alpha